MSNKEQIYVIGYVKSGNTWLASLLGDALNSPVKSMDKDPSLADGGYDRGGDYIIRQKHVLPVNYHRFQEHKIVYIIRDPRDVAVSIWHYWEKPSLMVTLEGMAGLTLTGPLKDARGWGGYVRGWEEILLRNNLIVFTSYERLSKDTERELNDITLELGNPCRMEKIRRVVKNQSFASRLERVKNSGDTLPYGETIQRKLMRKGIVGDWKNHFRKEHGELVSRYFGDLLAYYGYEVDSSWVKELSD